MPAGARFCPRCGTPQTPVEIQRGSSTPSGPHPPASWPGAPAEFRGTSRFRLLRRLGSGGMGIVYAAEDRKRHEVVALKTLLWADAAAVYRLKKEFRSLADVIHPNLVALYELVARDDNWFYTMELIDGVTFLEYLRQSPDRVEGLRALLRQIAAGVAAIHGAGKLHRDLKPSNVLVTRDGRAVILDFGIASDTAPPTSAPRTVEHGIWGTVEYMAPEQADGAAVPESDWYALGVMLYQALTGQLPFVGTTRAVLSQKWVEEPPRPDSLDPTLPGDLVQLCVDLMARAPSNRPDDAAVLDRVGAAEPRYPTGRSVVVSAGAIVGRERHLSVLRDAFLATRRGAPVRVYVHGLSGSGKSTLIQHFLHELARTHRAVLLQGHGHRTLVVRHRRAVRAEELPGDAPLIHAKNRPATGKLDRGVVEEGDPALGVGRKNGGGEGLQQVEGARIRLPGVEGVLGPEQMHCGGGVVQRSSPDPRRP